ncbi:putative membrane protein [Enterobacter cloacae S611]|uniref:Membrane protein n=1 Tax=Enterobacter cloacae S611 TaxID=1399146 RepID=A0ABN0QCJ6_ENTCL|nr:hypothetical protein [Kosakonia sp. HypNH10]ESS60053.1 putative membrane protein [Enterobacter cloacae S611]MDH2915131.1 hypothetical protein [Kosakonia sp. HypNH10]
MKIMNLRNKIFIFWGVMDVLALLGYLFFSMQSGNVPFYSDISAFYSNYGRLGVSGVTGGLVQLMFFINIALIVSLIFSAWSFLAKKNINMIFFVVQEIARVFSLKCSVALIPMMMHLSGFSSAWGAVVLFMLSEALKIGSVVWAKRNGTPRADAALTR